MDRNEIDANEDRLINREQLAAMVNVGPRTVARMVQRGELPQPCLSDGGRPRWLKGFVLDFLRRRHERAAKQQRSLTEKLK